MTSVNVKKLINELNSFIPYLITAYTNSSYLNSLDNIRVQDALFLYTLINSNCKDIREIEEFYNWLGEDCKWMYRGVYSGFMTRHGFMLSYVSERKHYALLYKLLMDLKKIKDENDNKA